MHELTYQARGKLKFQTSGPGFQEITREIDTWLDDIGSGSGLVTVFIEHTSASLTIQENADSDVQRDLMDALDRLAPRDHPYRHSSEGPDDMPSHIRAMVTSVSLTIPVEGGRMELGTWQGIYLIEHRDRPHRRRISLTYQGTAAG